MLDTSNEIQQKQLEIILAKTPQERFLIGTETIDFGRTLVESGIKQKNSKISELNLKIEVFKRYYSDVFNDDEIEKIIQSFINYQKNKILD
ncbi:MAG: hypothetical protein KAT68_14930 [Bacteroidales bacterium]|nr:hypothetical protein [Bacteroidales bacterium]